MRIFFSDDRKILSVSVDDTLSGYPPANQIYCPFVISNKVEKTVQIMRQKADPTGFPLFKGVDGKETRDGKTLGNENHPIVETVPFTRLVALTEAPGEWSIDDVLSSKYLQLADGKDFWFCEFFDDSSIDLDKSQVNTGFNGVSILPDGALQFKALTLPRKISKLSAYVEAGQDRKKAVVIEVSVDGNNFSKIGDFKTKSDTVIVRISDPDSNGVATPLHAFAIFY